jgi:hypothetical protein
VFRAVDAEGQEIVLKGEHAKRPDAMERVRTGARSDAGAF